MLENTEMLSLIIKKKKKEKMFLSLFFLSHILGQNCHRSITNQCSHPLQLRPLLPLLTWEPTHAPTHWPKSHI